MIPRLLYVQPYPALVATRADKRAEAERAKREDHLTAVDRPGFRDSTRLLTASALLGLVRLGDGQSRVLARTLAATPLSRIVPRLALRPVGDGRRSWALAQAFKSVALGRIPSEERVWVARIEARRRELASEQELTQPIFSKEPEPRGARWLRMHRPVAVLEASAEISIPPEWGLFLMRLVRELAPRSCLELGTGFGISAAYQAASLELNGAGRLTTLEGAGEWANAAERGAAALGLHNLEVRVGPLDDTLEGVLAEVAPVEFALKSLSPTPRMKKVGVVAPAVTISRLGV